MGSNPTLSVSKGFVVFIDGSCSGNPGFGGVGAVIKTADQCFLFSRYSEKLTTNNRMELSSLILAMEKFPSCHIQGSDHIKIYTDSKYLSLGWDFLEKWEAMLWKKANREPVSNQDLWKYILSLRKKYNNIRITWIDRSKNVIADALAQLATTKKLSLEIKYYHDPVMKSYL